MTPDARWQRLRRFVGAEKKWYREAEQANKAGRTIEWSQAVYVLSNVQREMAHLARLTREKKR